MSAEPRSRRDGRRARDAHALGDAEASASAARPPDGRLGARGRAAARRGAARRRRLAGDARRVRRTSTSPSRTRRSGPGDALARGARGARGPRRATCSSSRATRRCSRPRCSRELLGDAPRAQGAAATVLSFEPRGCRARTDASIRGADGCGRGDRRGRRRHAGAAGRARGQLLDLRLRRRRRCGRRSSGSSRTTRRASSTSPTRSRLLVDAGERVVAHAAADSDETEGVNTRAELARAAAALRDRINAGAHGCRASRSSTPARRGSSADVELEADCIVHPFTVLRGRTRVAAGAEIGPHAVVVDAEIGPDVTVGPFCYLRPGTALEAGAKAGTFVEIKNSHIGAGAKVPHLSYIGDADIGEGTNIGAGNITANFSARAGPAEGPDDDRPQRPDRRPQCVQGAGRDRRRRMDLRRVGHHRGRAARSARRASRRDR